MDLLHCGITLVISCEFFGILFIVFDEVIACLGMDAIVDCWKKRTGNH